MDSANALIDKAVEVIVNPILLILFVIALIIFLWGLVQFLSKDMTDDNRELGKQKIIWGLAGLLIMVTVFGIIRIVLNTFGIDVPDRIQ